jgi:hypothetical protein
MTATFQNSAMVLSIGFFFSLMIAGLSQNLISGPFAEGLTTAFWFAVASCLVATVASWFAGSKRGSRSRESVGSELAAVAGEAGSGPSEIVRDDAVGRGTPVLEGLT